MEAQEEVTTRNIVKGKRTKRQRVQSPIPFALTTSGGDGFVADDSANNGGGLIKVWSPTSSNELLFQENATEEEEDMANCLILLAQGHSRDRDLQKHHPHQDHNIDSRFYSSSNINNSNNNVKFNSRRFLETGSPGSGKAGYYVYDCKTCNKSFPSFQALGGHRASHKKPKAMNNNAAINDHEQKSQLALSSDEEDGQYKNMSSSLSLQLSNSNTNRSMYHSSNGNKSKIHECSICGAEFTSGQALGGHMRRHRGPIGGGGNSSALSLAIESEEPQKARNLLSLDLDLNLPAPEDDKLMQHFASKQQQQQQEKKSPPLVFSSPALVDCHY